MTFSYTHLGCKVNQYEIRSAAAVFSSAGFSRIPFEEGNADVVLINTCCVTLESEAKSRKLLNKARRMNPDAVIAVTGCFSEISPDTAAKCGSPDLIIPNSEKENIFDIVCAHLLEKGKIPEIPQCVSGDVLYADRTRATVKVQDGCDNFCTYCIIPYARGPLKSRDINAILEEVKLLAKKGYKEIVLTGIHLTRYGKDAPENGDLVSLCEAVSKVGGIERIRLGSIEPGYLNEDRAKRLSIIGKMCPHFHLALQSGSDGVLMRMNRHYTSEEYYNEVSLLKKYFENCAVTTDIMVGFPCETESEFNESLEFAKKVGFCKIHVFPYSMRPGTVAAKMEQVNALIKKQRTEKMLILAEREQEKYLKGFIGKTLSVLFERKKNGNYYGYTENYIHVCVESADNLSNTVRKVKILSVDGALCKGMLSGE